MACIDKLYIKYDEYLVLKQWCEQTELTYNNGKKGSPKDFLFSYKEPYEGEAPVWNTPQAFDNWLYYNCPLSFVKERLKEQYCTLPPIIVDECLIPLSTHYKVIKRPKAWFRFDDGCWIECSNLWYGWDSHEWYDFTRLMPPETRSSSYYCKYLGKRKFNRLIKKWKLPVGTKVIVTTRYEGVEFEVEMI